MDTLKYIVDKYNIDLSRPSPFWITFNRIKDLPVLFSELNFKSGAEIGTLEGVFSEILCRELPKTKIYSVDPWKYYPVRHNFRKSWIYEPMYQRVKAKLSAYPNSKIIRKTSMEAVTAFPDESLDFVFIDADHRFEYVTNDIAEWSKKVKKGGIISGHDFEIVDRKTDYVHIRHVVYAWTKAHSTHPWFILDDPLERGWMWVKA